MNNRMLLLWIAGGAGVILLYSAFKGKSPTGVLTDYASGQHDAAPSSKGESTPSGLPSESSGVGPVSADFVTDVNGFTVDVPPEYRNFPELFVPSRNMNNDG